MGSGKGLGGYEFPEFLPHAYFLKCAYIKEGMNETHTHYSKAEKMPYSEGARFAYRKEDW